MELITKSASTALKSLRLLGTLGRYSDPWLDGCTTMSYQPDLGYIIHVDVHEENVKRFHAIVGRMPGIEIS